MKKYLPFLFLLYLSVAVIACKDKVDCELFHWSYEGDTGPEHWATCSSDCDGQDQSPVDIFSPVQDNTLPALLTQYEDVPVSLLNNGHTIEFEYEPGSSVTYGGVEYVLSQFHFHTASEHTLAGQHFPLEAHLVHKDTITNNLLVVGIFFETGNSNLFLEDFIEDLPDEKDEHFSSAQLINVNDLLPSMTDYYTYIGSLTTPPCSEVVTWIVLKNPVDISTSQLQSFVDILNHNNRPVQPLNGRVIKESN